MFKFGFFGRTFKPREWHLVVKTAESGIIDFAITQCLGEADDGILAVTLNYTHDNFILGKGHKNYPYHLTSGESLEVEFNEKTGIRYTACGKTGKAGFLIEEAESRTTRKKEKSK